MGRRQKGKHLKRRKAWHRRRGQGRLWMSIDKKMKWREHERR